MAPHIISVTGTVLRDMLVEDGWTAKERAGKCRCTKDGHPDRGFPLSTTLDLKLVKSIAETAGWGAAHFDELRRRVMAKPSPSA